MKKRCSAIYDGRICRLLVTLIPVLLIVGALPVAAQETTANHALIGCSAIPCVNIVDFPVTTDGVLRAEVVASSTCNVNVNLSLDRTLIFSSQSVSAVGNTGLVDLGPVTPGAHILTTSVNVDNFCPQVWQGTLSVTTTGIADDDIAFVAPNGSATVSTAFSGYPRPAGITATLTRTASATTTALLSVITYDGFPSGLPPSPIRSAGFLDLQLTNGDPTDTIVGEFLPPSPILPPNPVLPPNPIVPPNPILPPNPIRLAYWDGNAWSPVLDSFSNPPTYSSVANVFNMTFNATSTPSITSLGGTVFAVVSSYYFRGFGTPVDSNTINAAKAGRAIPLKWQVFDHNAVPVEDLDPAVVRISSIGIPCAGTGGTTDEIEEYATGGSGLQYQGDGIYQFNWDTSKSYAGTCRRVRLDLGERNPDGSVFYRTADFQFKK